MKARTALILSVFLLIGLFPLAASAQESVFKQELIQYSTGSKTVTYVTINLNHPGIQVQAAVANQQLGTTASLKDIAAQLDTETHSVVAAINGTFFSAYEGLPISWGDIKQNGEFVHLGNTGSTIGFTADNQVYINSLSSSIRGYVNGQSTWYAWNINHLYDTPGAIVIYTPLFGPYTVEHNLTSIIIDQGKVVGIQQGTAAIPPEGYVIVTGLENIVRRFSMEDEVSYEVITSIPSEITSDALHQAWNEEMITAVGAGPTLLRNGVIIADGTAEGFFEDKINETRAQRSFIGVTADNRLIMGTVPSVNLRELAEIGLQLNLVNAINLDGGASSGLYYQGQIKVSPGRHLSNALVITLANPSYQTPIQVQVDGTVLPTQSVPIVVNNSTLLPLRDVFEGLGAQVTWDPLTQTATAAKGDYTLQITEGQNHALINGQYLLLDTPSQNINNTLFVPVRAVAEGLGSQVQWDEATRTVNLITQ